MQECKADLTAKKTSCVYLQHFIRGYSLFLGVLQASRGKHKTNAKRETRATKGAKKNYASSDERRAHLPPPQAAQALRFVLTFVTSYTPASRNLSVKVTIA